MGYPHDILPPIVLSVQLALYVAALVLLILAAIGVRHPRVDLLATGLALWLLGNLTRC